MESLTDSFKNMQVKKVLFTESEDLDEDTLNISSWKNGLQIRRSLSCGDMHEEFYPAEIWNAMIFRDEPQEAQAGNTLQNVTSCSSWKMNSENHFFAARTVTKQCRELFVDYKDFSECASLNASTPKLNRLFPFTPDLTKTEDTIESCVEDHNADGFARRDSALLPMLLYGTTTANEFNVPQIVGRSKKLNTQTLKAGEISKDSPRASSSSEGNANVQSFDFRGCDDTTLRISVKNNIKDLNGDGELWIVQPQVLEMDSSGRGKLLLINKSSYRNLKFKIVFDGKLINVCPQSGNLKSKSQQSLRVAVSRCMNENANEVVEDVIRITCGKIEKRVPVKIRKVQKNIRIKDRSLRYF